jgi:hypothetical protein
MSETRCGVTSEELALDIAPLIQPRRKKKKVSGYYEGG